MQQQTVPVEQGHKYDIHRHRHIIDDYADHRSRCGGYWEVLEKAGIWVIGSHGGHVMNWNKLHLKPEIDELENGYQRLMIYKEYVARLRTEQLANVPT